MIEKIAAYKSSDGKVVGAIEEVQKHEIRLIAANDDGEVTPESNAAIDRIVAKRDLVVDILTTGPRSKSKARAINGGTKKRRVKDAGVVVAPAGEFGPAHH